MCPARLCRIRHRRLLEANRRRERRLDAEAETIPLRALDMAVWAAGGNLEGLIHHNDHGSNYFSIVYIDRIGEFGAKPSTGTVGDWSTTRWPRR